MLLSLVLTVAVMYTPGLNAAFSLAALSLGQFFSAIGIALLIIPIVELGKLLKRSLSRR